MPLKAITIDFWNTLFDSSYGLERNSYRQRALIKEIDKYGIVIKKEKFNEAMHSSWLFFDNIWKNEYRTPTPLETVDHFWKFLELPYNLESMEVVVREFADCVLTYPPKLLPGVRESLEILNKKFDLAIVSDTGFTPGSVLKKLLEQENIFDYFKAFSFSDETGVSKPHEKAFLHALGELGFNPEEALHIGDIEKTDITGAKRLGMKAIRYCGDETAFVSKGNSKETEADAESCSWHEIVEMIDSL